MWISLAAFVVSIVALSAVLWQIEITNRTNPKCNWSLDVKSADDDDDKRVCLQVQCMVIGDGPAWAVSLTAWLDDEPIKPGGTFGPDWTPWPGWLDRVPPATQIFGSTFRYPKELEPRLWIGISWLENGTGHQIRRHALRRRIHDIREQEEYKCWRIARLHRRPSNDSSRWGRWKRVKDDPRDNLQRFV